MSREAQPAYVKGQRLWLVDDATGAFDTEVLVEQVVAREPSRKTGADFFAALVAPLTGHTGGGEKESLPGSVAVAPAGGGPAVWIRPEQLAARLSPVPQLAWPSPQQASGAWDAGSACVLCSEGAEAQFAGRGLFIPKDSRRDVACSVRAAASALNEGTLECSEGFCAVFSSDRGQWYVLHRAGLRDAALTSFGLPDGRVPPPSGPPGMTPRLACSGSVLGLPGDGPTFEPGDRIEMKRYDGEDWEAGGEVRDVVTDGPRQLGDLEMPVGSVLVAFQNGAALKWVWAQEVPTRLRKEESDRSHRDESDSDSGAVFDLDAWAAADASGSEAVAEVLGFSAGDGAEVWSNSKGVWLPCLVLAVFPHEVEADGFTVPPNTVKVQSEAGVKYIREDAVQRAVRVGPKQ
ncbi:unnamed protein product [Prorocentrum cordatum]|uniref:Uncharacterized protein n=1 Tax=Prorocentrum cordatum TaxID=2364126 RepID=A0ABN9PN49_9DINO|nr:unnamed protein product [Polarella glacialis]